MKKRLPYLILPILTIILEALPFGAVLVFARPATNGTIGRFRELYSYFSLMPVGYANFAPMITAILSCAVLVIVVVYCITGKHGAAKIARNVLCVCAVISLGPLFYGVQFFSIVGGMITLSLVAELLLLHNAIRKRTV